MRLSSDGAASPQGENVPGLTFNVLGVLEVRGHGRLVPLAAAKQRMILAVLLSRRGEVVSSGSLALALWPHAQLADVRGGLQGHVSRLRLTLARGLADTGPAVTVETVGSGYRVQADVLTLDSARFEHLVGNAADLAMQGDWSAASANLDAALALWRGPAFGDLADVEPIRLEAQRLDALREVAVEDRFAALLNLGHHHALIGELRMAVDEHPFREGLWTLLMRALYLGGRQTEALRAAAELRRRLADEAGLEPGAEIARLEQDILRHAPELQPTAGTAGTAGRVQAHSRGQRPAPGVAARTEGIPAGRSSFVGREAELASLVRLLSTTPLVTVTGPPGVGKTRLATELGRLLDQTVGDVEEVRFVALAPLADSGAVDDFIATSLNLAARVSPRDAIVDAIGQRSVVLILDNAEHLVEAVADLVETLLDRCQHLRLLVTSRQPLGPVGEQVIPLQPLPPGPSATLFRDRALAVDPRAVLAEEVVARICRRLDGIPLAIELAAARARSLSLPELADRLEASFGLLTAIARPVPERHRTMQAAIDWSYQLLPASQRLLFDRLSVFAGGFTLDAAEAVAGFDPLRPEEVIDQVDQLVARSLVGVDATGVITRYGMLQPIRELAADRLAAAAQDKLLAGRHARYFTGFAERHGGHELDDAHPLITVVTGELDNVRLAFQTVVSRGDADLALRLSTALHGLWWHIGLAEVGTWVAAAADLNGAEGHQLYRVAHGQAALAAAFRIDVPAWEHHCALAADTWWEAYARCWWPTSYADHLANSRRLVALTVGDHPKVRVLALGMLVMSSIANDVPHQAVLDELAGLAGIRFGAIMLAMVSARQALAAGDTRAALTGMEEMIKATENLPFRTFLWHNARVQALLWRYEAEPAAGLAGARSYLVEARRTGSLTWVQCALARIAAILERAGRGEAAAALAAFTREPAGGAILLEGDPAEDVMARALATPTLTPALARGQRLGFDDAIQLALDELTICQGEVGPEAN